jgi:Protein of unknown function (DUF1691)
MYLPSSSKLGVTSYLKKAEGQLHNLLRLTPAMSDQPPPHRPRRVSMGIPVEDLPPEPLHSNPLVIHSVHDDCPPTPPPPSHIPSLPSYLTLLQATHRYSSYVLTGFLSLHALNTCIIPLTTVFSSQQTALSKIDNGFMITRYLYRPSEHVELGLVIVPLAIHVATGMILRVRTIIKERSLYGEGLLKWHARQTRINRANGLSWPRIRALPTLGYSPTAASGWATLFFVSLHATTTRYFPWTYGGDGETSVGIVSHALQKHPLLGYAMYGGLIAAATFHIVSGWGRWLRVTFTKSGRRIKNYLVLGTVAAWMGGLVRVVMISVVSGTERAEFDALYQHLWVSF